MKETVYFGTYTRRISQGIYKADFDTETGKLANLKLFAAEPSPTYLAFDQDQHLYTVGSHDGKGGIAAYKTDGSLLNHVVEEGAPHCYVAVDEKRSLVYGANYHKGQVLVYKRKEDGSLELADIDQHTGHGPHENQTSPHVHYTDLTPDQYLVTCDLGTDQVTTYDVSPEGQLKKLASYNSNPGAGARHLVFHHHYKIAYLICELNSTIEVLIYDGVHGDREDCPMGVAAELRNVYEDLSNHMMKEEHVLFPMIKAGNYMMAQMPIRMMEMEHAEHGEHLDVLKSLTNNMTPPADACNTWRALYSGIQEFADDLMMHIHRENNILFPRVIAENH